MPSPELLKEAERLMTICNACRYCEGYCAVFPAMERRRTFTVQDLAYLSNLCFDCRACFYACPYSPPHEFAVNIPKTFAELRMDTYQDYTWPRLFSPISMALETPLSHQVGGGDAGQAPGNHME